MDLGRVGRSPAGQRIWMAGEKFQRDNQTEDLESLAPQIDEIDAIWERLNLPPEYWHGPIATICMEVAAKHDQHPLELKGRRMLKPIMAARLEAYYRCAAETDASYVQIGRAMNRDHTTVLSGIRRYASLYKLPLPRGL